MALLEFSSGGHAAVLPGHVAFELAMLPGHDALGLAMLPQRWARLLVV